MKAPDAAASVFGRKARLSLDFVVVGASISGLAVAFNLVQAGHSVHVLEKRNGIEKSPTGLRCPPNMTRLLQLWGLKPQMDKCGVICNRVDMLDGPSGKLIGHMLFPEVVMQELASDVYLFHQSDVHEMLYNLAITNNVEISFGCEVVSIDPTEPSVTLANGQTIKADLIIGADGQDSLIRRVIKAEEMQLSDPMDPAIDAEDKEGLWSFYGFTVPCDRIRKDKNLALLAKDPIWNIFCGNKNCVLTHITRGGRDLCVSIFWDKKAKELGSAWDKTVPLDKFDFSEYDPRVKQIADLSDMPALSCAHIEREPLELWYHSAGKVVLVGMAAHVLNPGGSHNASTGVEDAGVLGSLFSRLQSASQIPDLLGAYQTIREERMNMVKQSEWDAVRLCTWPPGPERTERDIGLRAAVEQGQQVFEESAEFQDDWFRNMWELYREVFAYDAYEEADNWWMEWGILRERSGATNDDMAQMNHTGALRIPMHAQAQVIMDG